MIKRILMLILVAVMIMSTTVFGAFSDVDYNSEYGKAIDALTEAGILSGYGNGEFGSKDNLTRAQFAKIVVVTAGREESAKSKNTEVFTDVPASHWAIGYINEAASIGLITGYPDGSFGADEKITYAQALTIIIRMLGYTENEVGTNWPNDYINKASELGITKGMTFGRNEYLTRESAAYVIYNSLFAKSGSGTAVSDIKKVEDVIIYGDSSVNSGIGKDEVLTTAGTFKKGNAYKSEYLGKEVALRINSDNEIVMITPKMQDCIVYTAILGSNDELETIENGTVDIDSLSVVYYKGSKGTFFDKGTTISFGSKVYIYDDYIYVEEKKSDSTVAAEELLKETYGSEQVAIDYEWLNGSKGEILTKYEDVIIYGTNSNNSSIPSEHVMTTSGLIKKGNIFRDEFLGKKVELRVNAKAGIIAIIPDSEAAKEYTLLSAYSNKIETKEDGIIEIDGKISVYYDGSAATYNDIYAKITPGCKIYMYEDYMYIEENELIGPYTITKDYTEVYEFFGDIGEVGVTIDGETTTVSDIEKYDVVYYNDKTARIYAYSQKVTGIYEKATPSKSNLTGIQLSGVSYNALSADAIKKLDDTLGAFKINDRITLLFGHDGTVVDVVDIDGRTLDDMGVLLRSYSAISKEGDTLGKNEHFAEIMLGSGNTVTYKTDKIYNDEGFEPYIGKFVYITNKGNGIVKLELAKENKLTGSFDKSVPSYAGHKLQQNYSILELVHSEKYGEAVVRKVNLKDISVSSLSADDIIHVEYANSMEDIALIYVNNITYDGYTFGVLNKAISDDDANYTYELKSSGGTTTYTGNAGWSFVKGEAVMVLVKNNKIKDIKELVEIASVSGIEDYTDTRIKVNGKVYEMDENVSVVLKHIGDSNYNITTISDFEENVESGLWKIGSVSVYADKRTNGKVRVIRITLK